MPRILSAALVASVVLFATRPAAAHFPWIAVNKDGKVVYFFGENPADRTYKLPDSIAKAKIRMMSSDGKARKVKTSQVEGDDFIGLVSNKKVASNATLSSQVTYGIFRDSRLNYYTMYHGGPLPKTREAYASKKGGLDLQAQLVDTDNGVDVFVLWKGKPLADVTVQLYCDAGHEEGTAETDKSGKVSFTDKQVEDGLNGIMLGHTVKGESGKLGDQEYEATSHYLTVTFQDPQDFEKEK